MTTDAHAHPVIDADDAARYARFRERVVAGDPVEVTTGPGGISFYVRAGGRRRFAGHFNARPRRGEDGLGFADLKPASTGLDPDAVVAALEARLAGIADMRRGAAWWSAHFAAGEDAVVAGALRAVVVEPILHAHEGSDG